MKGYDCNLLSPSSLCLLQVGLPASDAPLTLLFCPVQQKETQSDILSISLLSNQTISDAKKLCTSIGK